MKRGIDIRGFIQVNGSVSSGDIMRQFEISKPTAIKLLKESNAIAIGNSVNREYALPQPIGENGFEWNLYKVDEQANIVTLGILYSTNAGFYFDGDYPSFYGDEFKNKLFPTLPWFLYEHRPQGFIGRNIVYNLNKNLGISKELNNWTDADILGYLLRFGDDLPGSLILGDFAKDRFLQGKGIDVDEYKRAEMYPEFAKLAVENGMTHSSAAGEQPKFCALIHCENGTYRNVIVKFSGDMNNPVNRRWGDLLIAEHVALQVLSNYGFVSSESQIIESQNRVFLEYNRIDRVGRYGRRGISSLSGIDAAFIGEGGGSWSNAMGKAKGYFSAKDIDIAERIYNFGLAIGNTDMHFGNISFFVNRNLPFELAPIYDMLPMYYAPKSDGTLQNEALASIPPTRESRTIAKEFWQMAIENASISDSFKLIAQKNIYALS